MWLSESMFGAAFVGLVVLFALKALEMRGKSVWPLLLLRRADPLVSRAGRKVREHAPVKAGEVAEAGYRFCIVRMHEVGVFLHRHLARCSRILGEYLKKNGAAVSKDRGYVSVYIRSMMEHKEQLSRAEKTNSPPLDGR